MWTVGPLDEWGTFVDKSRINHPDIICHTNASPVPGITRVAAGNDVTVKFNLWPEGHPGPILSYLARCDGPCSEADKTQLEWFKISEEGMYEDSKSPVNGQYLAGRWATTAFLERGKQSSIKMPMVAPGNYLFRYEIISLHQADQPTNPGAQFYPFCINLEITGSGTARPSGIKGTELYKATDPGFNVNVFNPMGSYPMPGPKLFTGGSEDTSASATSSSVSSSSASVTSELRAFGTVEPSSTFPSEASSSSVVSPAEVSSLSSTTSTSSTSSSSSTTSSTTSSSVGGGAYNKISSPSSSEQVSSTLSLCQPKLPSIFGGFMDSTWNMILLIPAWD